MNLEEKARHYCDLQKQLEEQLNDASNLEEEISGIQTDSDELQDALEAQGITWDEIRKNETLEEWRDDIRELKRQLRWVRDEIRQTRNALAELEADESVMSAVADEQEARRLEQLARLRMQHYYGTDTPQSLRDFKWWEVPLLPLIEDANRQRERQGLR